MRKYGGEWKTRKHTFFKERSFYECDMLDGTGAQPGGATPGPRSGALAAICWSSREEIPQVQGQGHWQRFAGAAVKRYPRSKVRETPVRR